MKELLELIEKHPCMPKDQLAQMTGLTEQEVRTQIQAWEENKTIVKYQALINWEKAGLDSVTAMIEVKITPQREVGFDAIAERIYRFPEVRTLCLMSGGYDLLVVIEGNSLREVAQFVSMKLSTIEGVVSTSTNFMLKKYKEAGVIFDDKESDHRLVVSP